MPTEITSAHFEFLPVEARQVVYELPGVTGPVVVNLNRRLRRIRQTGFCNGNQAAIAEVELNQGDPSVLVSVDTLLQTATPNCYKVSGTVRNVPSSDGGEAEYEIIWDQLSP